MNATHFDAVIVGAGPAGSAAAILLARSGWTVALVEQQRFPRRKVCGECIAASNLPLLEVLGIGSALKAAAGPELRHMVLMHGKQSIVADLPAAAHTGYRWGRALGRETLDALLLEEARLSGAVILQPWALRNIDGTAGDWRFEIRAVDAKTSATLQAPVAIDAHGSWESLPTERPSHRHHAGDLLAFKANFCNVALNGGVLPVLLFEGGYGGMVVADQGVTTVACCIRRDRLDALRRASPGLGAGEVVEAMLKRECSGVRKALGTASRNGAWLAAGPLAPGVRIRPDDTVFRLGNAAGEAHPILGEGMSMALQSAWLLCAHLTGACGTAERASVAQQRAVASNYARDWHRRFRPRMRLAAAFAHVAMRPASASPLMALTHTWPGLLTLGARWGGKVRYLLEPQPTISECPL